MAYILSIALLFLSTNNAYAYLDPGSATLIIQTILASIAGSVAALVLYWQKIVLYWHKLKTNIKNLFKKDKDNNS